MENNPTNLSSVRNLTVLVFCLLINLVAFGQQSNPKKSLLRTIFSSKSDSTKVMHYYELGRLYEGINNDSALVCYDKGMALSKQLNWSKGQVLYATNASFVANIQGHYESGLKINLQSIELAKKINDKTLLAKCYNNTGSSYLYLKQEEKALSYYLMALRTFEISKNYNAVALIESNLSVLYQDLHQYDKALDIVNQAWALHKKGYAPENVVGCLNTKLNVLIKLKRFKEALNCAQQALVIAKKNQNVFQQATLLGNICELNLELKNYTELIPLAAEHAVACKLYGSNQFIAYSNLTTAGAYFYNKKFEAARKSALASLTLAQKDTLTDLTTKSYAFLSSIEFALGNVNEGKIYQDKQKELDDITLNQEIEDKTKELETKYENETKVLKIDQLSKENQIQKLQNKRRFWIIMALIFGIIAVVLLLWLQFKNYRDQKIVTQQQQQLAIAEERIRIANDMHDDVGAGLSRIRFITSALKNDNDNGVTEIDKIIALSDDAVDKMNEIIWALNQGNQKLDELIYYIRSQCGEMVNIANLIFSCEPPESIPDIVFGWKENRNTYLLVKEAVNNAIKHATATQISIDFKISDQLYITVKDNGVGFKIDSTRYSGNGLKNYQKRIETLHGKYNIDSNGQGTEVHFIVPLPVV